MSPTDGEGLLVDACVVVQAVRQGTAERADLVFVDGAHCGRDGEASEEPDLFVGGQDVCGELLRVDAAFVCGDTDDGTGSGLRVVTPLVPHLLGERDEGAVLPRR